LKLTILTLYPVPNGTAGIVHDIAAAVVDVLVPIVVGAAKLPDASDNCTLYIVTLY
jgi:hypothetical protein